MFTVFILSNLPKKQSNLNLQAYIESGVLELYVLDQLSHSERNDVKRMFSIYPSLKIEILKMELALERYAKLQAVAPSANMEDTVINRILNLEADSALNINNLPLIDENTDYKKWQELIDTLSIEPLMDGRAIKVLRNDAVATQMLVISETDVEEETHEKEIESFLILAGECKCTVGNEVRFMGVGDFMQIPLYEKHHVQVLSRSVTAILQHFKL